MPIRALKRALDALPAEQRRALELAYWDGLSQREISEHTGDPLGTVKTAFAWGCSGWPRCWPPERKSGHGVASVGQAWSRLASPAQVLVLSLVVLCPGGASAHAPRLSRGDWSFESGSAEARLTFHRGELRALAPDGLEETAARDAVPGRLATSVQVLAGGQPCALEERAIPAGGGGTAGVRSSLAVCLRRSTAGRCSSRSSPTSPLGTPTWHGSAPAGRPWSGSPGHHALLRDRLPSERAARGRTRFFRLGVEHIFTGWDHLAFLLALLLLGGRLRTSPPS